MSNLAFHKTAGNRQEQRNWNIQLASEGMPYELQFEHEQLAEETSTELEKAGVDSSTPTDTFLEMQGRNIFCTGDSIYGCAEKGELASSC